jgi:hypothetical protein
MKRLKDPHTPCPWAGTDTECKTCAMVARLEAAEKIVRQWDKNILVPDVDFEAWRKACGK